ncbi:hypothetical protein R50912_10800 [Paenibacillus sp. FSL R5-0912]|nr:hypothetical protein R50912_10800 [Paenibacillus sp. FSL R5-0912]
MMLKAEHGRASGKFLVQPDIPQQLPSSRFHDYRMLVQKNGQGFWEFIGIDRPGSRCAYQEDSFGASCELALDLAIDREGKIYELEVNPKPAREVFARSGVSGTYRKTLVRPLEYAMWVYKNKNTPSSAKTVEEEME